MPRPPCKSSFVFFNPSWQNIINICEGKIMLAITINAAFSYGLLKDLLKSCGITKVKGVIKIRGCKNLPFIPEDLHVKGIKL